MDSAADAKAFERRFTEFMRAISSEEAPPSAAQLRELIEQNRDLLLMPGVSLASAMQARLEVQLARLLTFAGDIGGAVACHARSAECSSRAVAPDPCERSAHAIESALLHIAAGFPADGVADLRRQLSRYRATGGQYAPGHDTALFFAGEYAEAFRVRALKYADRWLDGLPRYRRISSPAEWRGLDDRVDQVVVVTEGGNGDQLQQLQLHPLLAVEGRRIHWHIRPELLRLAQQELPVPHVARPFGVEWAPVAGRTVAVRGWDLPYVLGLAARRAPLPGAFARPASPRAEGTPLTIGFSWKGSPSNLGDQARSSSLLEWAPLFVLPGIRWLCLQPHRTAAELAMLAMAGVGVPRSQVDFADTATAARRCDLLLTVNSSLAHLGGVLDVPTWVLLNPAELDGQWGAVGEESFWYRSVRLWRQQRPGEWTALLTRIRAALLDLDKRRSPQPTVTRVPSPA